jgi:hypothetical protein
VLLQGKTFIFTQEINSSDEINGKVIKSIINGGDKQTCRETKGNKDSTFQLGLDAHDVLQQGACHQPPR